MGLGLFIAKTLLERSGADLSFANASDATSEAGHHPDAVGAVVQLTWPRARIEAETADDRRPSGENLPFRA